MADELVIGLSIALGAFMMWMVYASRKKMWFLETMNPRQHYQIGKEGKLISHMSIGDKHFHGVEAGRYRLLLMYGDLATFSKPVLSGKIEEMYMSVLASSLIGRKFVTKLEKFRFQDFLFRHIPSLSITAYLITGELISPQDILDLWKGDKRDEALSEMKRRGLINSKVLWIKPYPPEDQLKDILTGAVTIPDMVLRHEQNYAKVALTQRETLFKIDAGIAALLEQVIMLYREIVASISDPLQVMSIIIVDRLKKIEGLGIEQLIDRGSIEGAIQAAKRLTQYKDEINKALSQDVTPEEKDKIAGLTKKMAEIEKLLQELTGKTAAAPQIKTPEK